MNSNEINAAPSKEFFISMITKDIKLERAIIDLVDNSIDGAKKIRSDSNFEGLEVEIFIDEKEFIIKDNCGGFDLNTAINYAFMFGRPDKEKDDLIKNSVGRFGIGMKRALFKMGNAFEVESKCDSDHFEVNVDANKWLEDPNNWKFQYSLITSSTNDIGDEDGTFIKVKELNEDVSSEFRSQSFLSALKEEIEKSLNFSIERGIKINLNNITLEKKGLFFLMSDTLSPYYKELKFDNGVTATIYAGIGEPSPDKGGWYLYCNDRLVLESDKSNQTGWEGRRFGESSVRKYHNYFAMFRGVVFFNSEDSKLLPMTTTKTGIDVNSKIYNVTKQYMIDSMQQVIAFLSEIANKQEEPVIYRSNLVENSSKIDIIQLKNEKFKEKFVSPKIEEYEIEKNNYTTVSFWAEKDIIKKCKKRMGVNTNKQVGENCLEYYLDMENIKD